MFPQSPFFTSIPLCRLLKAHVKHNVGNLTMISQGKSKKKKKKKEAFFFIK